MFRPFRLGVADVLILGFWSAFVLTSLALAAWVPAWRDVFAAGFSLLSLLVALYLVAGLLLQRGDRLSFRAGQVIRFAAIAVSLIVGHDTVGIMIGALQRFGFERYLWSFDLWLFGAHPTEVLDRFTTPFLTEWFQFWYTVYFFLPLPIAFSLVLQDRKRALDRFGFFFSIVIYSVFLCYMLVPCRTPDTLQILLRENGNPGLYHWSSSLHGVWLADYFRALIYRGSSNVWDAFPSGHAATVIVCTLGAWKYTRRLFVPVLFVAVNVILSTVYLRYHYVLDLLVSMALCGFLYLSFERIHDVLAPWVARVVAPIGSLPEDPGS